MNGKNNTMEFVLGQSRHVRYSKNHASCQMLFIICFICIFSCLCLFFFRAHRALLLKFIVLQICRREPFRIVCGGGDSGYANMRHAFTIIDIWCVFISEPQLVHIHSHTSHMHSHLPSCSVIHFHFYSKSSTLSNWYCYRVICLLAINAIAHYLFHRFYCKYSTIKRDKFHWGEKMCSSRWVADTGHLNGGKSYNMG